MLGEIINVLKHDAGRLWALGAVHIGLSSWVVRFVQVAQRILLARILGADMLGHIAVVNSAINIVGLPAGAGMFTAVAKLVAENRNNVDVQRAIVGTALRIALVTSFTVMVVAWFVLSFTNVINDEVANKFLKYFVLLLPVLILTEILRCVLQGQRRMRILAGVDITFCSLGLLLVVPMTRVWFLHGWAANKIAVSTLLFFTLCYYLRSVICFEWSERQAGRLTKIGIYAFLGQLVGALILQFDTLCLSAVLKDPETTGLYNTAAIVSQHMLALPGALIIITFPFVAENVKNPALLKSRYKEIIWKMFFVSVVLAVLAGVSAPVLFKIFGSEFVHAVPAFRILLLGFIARCLYVIDNTYLDGVGRTDLTFVSGIIAAVATIILNLVFIPRWGMIGAAWATTLAMYISLGTRQLMVHHYIFKRNAVR